MIEPGPKGSWSRKVNLIPGAGICLALAGVLSCSGPAPDPQANWSDAKKARVEAAARQRRIIFNDDSYELSRDDAGTPEGFLKRRLQPLAGTQVDTVSWSILGGWADAPVYDSKIQPIYGDAHGGPPAYWSKVTANVKRLIQSGRGPLQIVIDFARSHGMEILASVRMNDVHDSFIEGGLTTWKKEHPEFLVDPLGRLTSLDLYVTSQDFSHPEVRQRKFEIIEEVSRRYDVDGFELDFIRHPVFFSPTMQGKPVSTDQVEVMTAFMRRIRKLTDSQAQRRGRPLLLATRVPDSFQLALNIGLDLKGWLEEDLVDILIAGGGYAPFSLPLAEFTSAAHPHGVLVYPCINQSAANNVSGGSFLEGVRGMASNWFRTGADGVYLWNLGTPFEYKTGQDLVETRRRSYACLSDIGERRTLAARNKLFCVDNHTGGVIDYYAHISSSRPLPVSREGAIKYGVVGRVPLVVGDDLASAKENGSLDTMRLVLDVRSAARPDAVVCRVNGKDLANGQSTVIDAGKGEYRMSYPVDAPPLRQGMNTVVLALKGARPRPGVVRPELLPGMAAWAQFHGVRLEVNYRPE